MHPLIREHEVEVMDPKAGEQLGEAPRLQDELDVRPFEKRPNEVLLEVP